MLKKIYKTLMPSYLRQKLNLGSRINKALMPVKIALSIPTKRKLSKIKFEIQLAEHCNLNCAGCNHFSSIADPEFVDVGEFEREVKRMGELFDHECERFYLIGGEPLLHPQIITLMKIARDNFSKGNITIFTNGTLLLQKILISGKHVTIIISAYSYQDTRLNWIIKQ